MKTKVTLPDGDFLTVHEVADAIATAKHQENKDRLVEIVIHGERKAVSFPTFDNGRLSSMMGEQIQDLIPLTAEKYAHIDADLKGLSTVTKVAASEVPRYAGMVTREQATSLDQKWRQQMKDEGWCPSLKINDPLEDRKATACDHIKIMKQLIQRGELLSIDLNRVRRVDASAYVVQCGYEVATNASTEAAIEIDGATVATTKAVSRAQAHDANILLALKELGFEAITLTHLRRGQRCSQKRSARELCVPTKMTLANFNDSWKRLSKDGSIKRTLY